MSALNSNICRTDFHSSDEFDNQKEKCVSNNNEDDDESPLSKSNPNLSILKTNNSLENECANPMDLSTTENCINNTVKKKRKSKMLIEIGGCSIDFSSVNGRTRNRNSVNGNLNSRGKRVDNNRNKTESDRENREKHSNKSSSKANSSNVSAANDKENSFVKIPTTIDKKSENKDYLSANSDNREKHSNKSSSKANSSVLSAGNDKEKSLVNIPTTMEQKSENKESLSVNSDSHNDNSNKWSMKANSSVLSAGNDKEKSLVNIPTTMEQKSENKESLSVNSDIHNENSNNLSMKLNSSVLSAGNDKENSLVNIPTTMEQKSENKESLSVNSDSRGKNWNKSSSNVSSSVVSRKPSVYNKENSFVKIPTKIETINANKVNKVNEYLSAAPVFRDRLGLKLNDGGINKRLESMNTFLERESENRCFVTDNCDFRYYSRESLINHIKQVHHTSKPIMLNSIENEKVKETIVERTDEDDIKAKKSNKLSFACRDCPEEFETFNQLKTHLLIHQYDSSQNNDSAPTSTVESESVTDNISTSETLSENIQVSPIQRSSLKRKKTYSDLPALSDSDEPPAKLIKCSDCDKKFQRESNYKVHKKKYHETPDPIPLDAIIKCDECSKEFTTKKLLEVHKSAYCFKSVALIQEWSSTNIGAQYQFGCGICGLAVKTSRQLQQHKQEAHSKFQMPIRKISNLN